MGEFAGTAVQDAVHALVRRDVAQAQEVIDSDDEIDDRYLDIEQRTMGARAADPGRHRPAARRRCSTSTCTWSGSATRR